MVMTSRQTQSHSIVCLLRFYVSISLWEEPESRIVESHIMGKFLRTFQSDFTLPFCTLPTMHVQTCLPKHCLHSLLSGQQAVSVGFAAVSTLYWPVTHIHSLKSFWPVFQKSLFLYYCMEECTAWGRFSHTVFGIHKSSSTSHFV